FDSRLRFFLDDDSGDSNLFPPEMLGGIINSDCLEFPRARSRNDHAEILGIVKIKLGIEIYLAAFLQTILGGADSHLDQNRLVEVFSGFCRPKDVVDGRTGAAQKKGKR